MTAGIRILLALEVAIITYLQVELWSGQGSVAEIFDLNEQIAQHAALNAELGERNQVLEAEVDALKDGFDAIEERARLELGMIKENETFFLVVD